MSRATRRTSPALTKFRWRMRSRSGGVRAGAIAGNKTTGGYRCVAVDGSKYQAHRLAWLHVHGVWPPSEIDHRNEDKTDNRIRNLREATNPENRQNMTRPYRGNASGYIGVTRHHQLWRAAIKVDGKLRYLGRFDTPEEASVAYLAAKAELHPFWSGR